MSALRRGQPIWLERAPSAHRFPTLSGRHQTDIVIVGGGLTGALVAHAFAAAGVGVIVLEAARVCRGSTAASSALLLQEADVELTQLTERYGRAAADRVWELGRLSVQSLVGLLRQLKIRCDLRTKDAIYYARDLRGAERLRREFTRRRRAGFGADWLTPGDLRRRTAIAGRAAILTRGNAQCDPYRAAVGVMRAAAAEGARVFEQSAVRRTSVERGRVRVWTSRGVVDARQVIVATGYATPEFKPLAGRFRMYRTFVLGTERLSAKQRDELGLSDVMIWDTLRPYHYARWTADRRLLLGGGDRLLRGNGGPVRQMRAASSELREYFESLLPALAGVRTAAMWSGRFATTRDSLPLIGPHRLYPRHWFALGYGGNGMTFGALAARLLLERWRGRASKDQLLFAFNRGLD